MERISDYFDLLLQTLQEHNRVILEELACRQIGEREGEHIYRKGGESVWRLFS